MTDPNSRDLDVSFAPVDVSAHPTSANNGRPEPLRQKSTVIFRPARRVSDDEYDVNESTRRIAESSEDDEPQLVHERLSTRRLDVSKGLRDSFIRKEMEEIGGERNTATSGTRLTEGSDFTITREDEDYGMDIWEDYKDELDAHYYAVDNKEKRRVQLLTCLAILAAVSLTLALVLGISYGTDKSTPLNNKIKTSTVLPLPPIIMGSKCTPENIRTPKGWSECEHVCQTAACCHIPIGTKGSCLDATFDICEQYEVSCRPIRDALAGGSPQSPVSFSVPPAPHDLARICTLPDVTNIVSLAHCEELCLPAACCLSPDPDTNCMKENAATCMAYVPYCGKISLHGVDPSTVEEKCAGGESGVEDCWAACATAACCFPEKFRKKFGRSAVGCDARDESWCEMFERCEVLPDMEEVYTEEDKIVFIEEVCTKEAVKETAGLNVCHDLCKARECCYSPSATGCSQERCDGYEPCKVLNNVNTTEAVGGKFINSVAHVNFACQQERIESSRWGYHACESVCEERQCCFLPEDGREKNCRSEKTEWCDEFDACKVLINATVPEADDASTPDFGKPLETAISDSGSTNPEITDGPVAMPGQGKPDNSGSTVSGTGSTAPEITDGPVAMPGEGKPDNSGFSSSSNNYGPGVGNYTPPEITDGPVAMPGQGKPDGGSAISGTGSTTPEITDGPVAIPGDGKPDNDGISVPPDDYEPGNGSTIATAGSTPGITDGPVGNPDYEKPDNSGSTVSGTASTTPEITDGPVAMPGDGKPENDGISVPPDDYIPGNGSTIAAAGSTPGITDGPVGMPGNGKPDDSGSTISTAGSTPEITDGPVDMHNDKPPSSGSTISGTGSTPEITDGPVGTPRSGNDKDRLAAPGYTPPDKDGGIVPPDDYEPPSDNDTTEDSRLAAPGYTPPDEDEGIVPPDDYEPPSDNETTEDSRLAKPNDDYKSPIENKNIEETNLAALDKSAVYDLVARIGEQCTINNILSPEGYQSCKELCSSRLCCFYTGSGNCRHDITKECHMFNECDNLNDVHMPSMP